jgi:D-glycero-D-manno-heptose 1,7-bisphosphate phosphatase
MSYDSRLRRAVFLDRDGTINVEKEYLHLVADFEFIPGVPQALKKLQDAGFLLVVVTNQSGVARGYYSLEDVDNLHRHMCAELRRYAVALDGIYVCPHHPTEGLPPYNTECDCRKGRPGMLLQAAHDLGICLENSYMIGDKVSDSDAGIAAGCISYMVETGHHLDAVDSVEIVADLAVAADKILSLQV